MNRVKLVVSAASITVCLLLLSACASNKISVRESEQIQGTAVMHYPMIAKMEIKQEKISHVYRNGRCSIEKDCEIIAYNDALKTLNIDGIFEPIFDHEVSMGATVTVTGYPYKYTEFREVTKEDKELLASPGSTWVPVQVNNRPYITNNTVTPMWQLILATVSGTLVVLLVAVATN